MSAVHDDGVEMLEAGHETTSASALSYKHMLKHEVFNAGHHPHTDKDVSKLLAKVDALVDEEINTQKPVNATICGFYFKDPQSQDSWMHKVYARLDGANLLILFVQIVLMVLFMFFAQYTNAFTTADQMGTIAVGTAVETLFTTWIGNMLFLVSGFGLVYVHAHKFILSGLGSVLYGVAFAYQWAILVNGFFVYAEAKRGYGTTTTDGFEMSMATMVTATFPVMAVMVSYGSYVGKATVEQLIFISFWEIIFYATNEWVNSKVLDAVDFGCFYVWTFGVAFGMAATTFFSRKDTKNHADNHPGHVSDALSMVGGGLMFVFFPVVNLSWYNNSSGHRVAMNTMVAMCASTVGAFSASKIFRTTKNQFDARDIRLGSLAGGIVMASVTSALTTPGVAIACGFVAGFTGVMMSFVSAPFWEWCGLRDTNQSYGFFGWVTFIGCMASVFSTLEAYGDTAGQTYNIDYITVFRWNNDQAAIQLAAWAISIIFGVVGGLWAGFFGKILIGSPLRYWNDGVSYRVYDDFLEREEADIRELVLQRELKKMQEEEEAKAAQYESKVKK